MGWLVLVVVGARGGVLRCDVKTFSSRATSDCGFRYTVHAYLASTAV